MLAQADAVSVVTSVAVAAPPDSDDGVPSKAGKGRGEVVSVYGGQPVVAMGADLGSKSSDNALVELVSDSNLDALNITASGSDSSTLAVLVSGDSAVNITPSDVAIVAGVPLGPELRDATKDNLAAAFKKELGNNPGLKTLGGCLKKNRDLEVLVHDYKNIMGITKNSDEDVQRLFDSVKAVAVGGDRNVAAVGPSVDKKYAAEVISSVVLTNPCDKI